MLNKMLVPFDSSEQSARALLFAVDLAKQNAGCEVTVFNVIQELPANIGMEMALGDSGNNKRVQEFLEEIIFNIKREVNRILEDSAYPNIQYDAIVGGDPAERIVQTAKDKNYDLIIMGAAGHSGLKKLTKVGSVSRKVMEVSPCPITIVH